MSNTIRARCKNVRAYTRKFRLGKLYYKFIKDSQLESQGWRSEDVAKLLESHGFIKILKIQDQDTKGRFTTAEPYYIECEGKAISRQEFFKIFKGELK